jgi:hypothetical protein
VLHIDERGVEAGKADDFDDLRIGNAARMLPSASPPAFMMGLTRFSCMDSSCILTFSRCARG